MSNNTESPFGIFNRDELFELVGKLAQCIEKIGISSYKAAMSRLIDKTSEDRIILSVFGSPGRGIKTFINHLLGDGNIAEGIKASFPFTLKISYGLEEQLIIAYGNGERKIVESEELREYLNCDYRPVKDENAVEANLYLPSSFLRQGITIVQLPELVSGDKSALRMADEHLKHSDAVVYLLSTDTLLSEAEVNFLKHTGKYNNKIYFVLNKLDLLKEEELFREITSTSDALERILSCQIKNFFPTALRYAVPAADKTYEYPSSGIEELYNSLFADILNEKASILYYSFSDRLLRTAESLLSSLRLRHQAMSITAPELKEAIDKFRLRKQEVNDDIESALLLIKDKCDMIIKQVEGHIASEAGKLIISVRDSLIELYKESQASKSRELSMLLIHGLEASVQNSMERLRSKEDLYIDEAFHTVSKDFKEALEKVAIHISDIVKDIFNIQYSVEYVNEYSRSKEVPAYNSFSCDSITNTKPIAAMGGMPGKLANKWLLNRVLNMVDEEVRKSSVNINKYCISKINVAMVHLQTHFDGMVSCAFSDLQTLLEQALKCRNSDGIASFSDSAELLKEADSLYSLLQSNSLGVDKRRGISTCITTDLKKQLDAYAAVEGLPIEEAKCHILMEAIEFIDKLQKGDLVSREESIIKNYVESSGYLEIIKREHEELDALNDSLEGKLRKLSSESKKMKGLLENHTKKSKYT